MAKSYDSKDILVLEGLDAVRLRPGMYIGTTGQKGLHHLLWEIADNAMDELSNGHGNKMVVTLHKDGSASVLDNGRGIPVDIHPQLKISGVEVVFTQLHAGGKFNSESYNYSGGLHGVGASVANALSEWLEVRVYKSRREYFMRFNSILGSDGKIKSGIPSGPLKEVGSASSSGTFVRFKPDVRVFKDAEFSFDIISKRLKELAFLNKGIEIILIDEREAAENQAADRIERVYKFDGGLADFCRYLNETKNPLFDKPVYFETSSKVLELTCALQWTDSYTESVFSYVNNIPTSEGGTHEVGFKSGLTKVLNDYARSSGALKEKEQSLMGEDYREGLTAVISIKMRDTQFEGQTKTKLGNPEARPEVERLVYAEVEKFFTDKSDKAAAQYAAKTFESIMQKARAAAAVREAERKAKEITRAKNSLESSNLVGKLSACSGKKAELNELFIVEGDSAGGSAKQARDRSFQAILPLRGKPLNAEKKRINQVLANEEIRTIISALGASIGEDFNSDNLKYHKVIILADADQDGAHIRAILLTFFFRYMKALINEGHVYIGLPPLYKVYKRDAVKYVYSDVELEEAVNTVGRGYMIQRYKGLGEMNPEQLWETTMNPEKRTLVRVTIEDAAEAEMIISTLMGDDVEARKNYIFENVDFDKNDKFETIAAK